MESEPEPKGPRQEPKPEPKGPKQEPKPEPKGPKQEPKPEPKPEPMREPRQEPKEPKPEPMQELEPKIISQLDLFYSEFDKLAELYQLKTGIDIDYVKKRLVQLNNANPEFTKTPLPINTDKHTDYIIDRGLLDKGYVITLFSKNKIATYLFNKTCINLGWFF